MSKITIKTRDPETTQIIIIAEGEEREGVEQVEDLYFFTPDLVNEDLLQKREDDEEHQDERGKFHYYDLVGEDGIEIRTEVCVVYHELNEGWEEIYGKYGFTIIDSNGVITEVDGEDIEQGAGTGETAMEKAALQD